MAKVLAMLASFSFCVYLGLSSSSRLRERDQALHLFRRFVRQITISMDYGRLPLSELIRQSAQGDEALCMIADDIDRGATAYEAYEAALAESAGAKAWRALTMADHAILSGYFRALGRSDARAQKEHGLMTVHSLDEAAAEAREAYASRGKMFRTLGLLLGTAIVILMV